MNGPSTTHLSKYAPARSRRITIGYKRAKGNKGERERQGTRLSHQHIPRSRAEVKVATMLRVVLACLPLICFMGYIAYTYVINNVCHQFHSVSQVQQSFIVGRTEARGAARRYPSLPSNFRLRAFILRVQSGTRGTRESLFETSVQSWTMRWALGCVNPAF